MRRRGRLDSNHPEIVKALEDCGAGVQSLANLGDGVPDLLVAFRGRWHVMEVKAGKNKLTADEQKWIDRFAPAAAVHIVHDVDEALRAVGAVAGVKWA